jgi:hypothetical protein
VIWTAANQGNQASQRLNSFTFFSAGQSGGTRRRNTALCPHHVYGRGQTVNSSSLPGNRTGNQASQRLISFTFLAQGSLGESDAAVPRSVRPMLMATEQSVVCRGNRTNLAQGSLGESDAAVPRSVRPMLMATEQSVVCLPGKPDKLSAGQSGGIKRRSTALCPAHAYGHRTVRLFQ